MIYHMLGFVLAIAWGVIASVYTIGNLAIIAESLIEHEELPSNIRVVKFLSGLTIAILLWWTVWVLHFYI